MKILVKIASIIATVSAADLQEGQDCSASTAKCATGLCCGIVYVTETAPTADELTTVGAGSKKMNIGEKLATICNTSSKTVFSKVYAAATTANDAYTSLGTAAGTYVGKFKCNATGAL